MLLRQSQQNITINLVDQNSLQASLKPGKGQSSERADGQSEGACRKTHTGEDIMNSAYHILHQVETSHLKMSPNLRKKPNGKWRPASNFWTLMEANRISKD
jgi:hypothetical protein